MSRCINLMAAIAVVVTFAVNAWGNWQQGGGTAFTVGTQGSVETTFDPTDPTNDGGDNGFTTGFNPNTGRDNVSFAYNGCCTAPPPCPGGMVPGVKVQWTASLATPGGPRTVSGGRTCCPATCCPTNVTITDSATNNWGGAVTGVSVTGTVDCICCNPDGSEPVDSPEWPDEEFGPIALTHHP